MKLMKQPVLAVVVALILAVVAPGFAAGPVYDELPDLEGAEVVVAVENFYTPYQFQDPRSEDAIGFEYDLIREICNRLNCMPVFETTTFDLQLTGVQSGEYDAAVNGIFITEERQEIYDFTIPYAQAEAYLLVRADEDRFTDFTDFAARAADEDFVIGVQNNSFGQYLVTPDAYNVPEDQVTTVDDFDALLVALQNGDIDAMVVDAFAGSFIHATAQSFKLIGEPVAEGADQGIIFSKGSEFAEPFSAAIASLQADGYLSFLNYKWSVDFQPVSAQ